MLAVVAVVRFNALPLFSEAEYIMKLTVIVGHREVHLVFDSHQDIGVVSLPCGLDDIYVNLRFGLGPVLDAVPVF